MKKFIENVKKLVEWLKSVASESDGSGSASRVVKLCITATCCASLLLVVLFKHDLPSAEQLKGLAQVIGMGSAAYALNQLKAGWVEGKGKTDA